MIVIADSTLGGYYTGDPFNFTRDMNQAINFSDLSSARKKAKVLARENQDAYFIVDPYLETVLEQVDG